MKISSHNPVHKSIEAASQKLSDIEHRGSISFPATISSITSLIRNLHDALEVVAVSTENTDDVADSDAIWDNVIAGAALLERESAATPEEISSKIEVWRLLAAEKSEDEEYAPDEALARSILHDVEAFMEKLQRRSYSNGKLAL